MNAIAIGLVAVGAYFLFGRSSSSGSSSSGPKGGIGARQPTEGETSSGAEIRLQPGELGSSLALWYTGSVGRWTELPSANRGLRIVRDKQGRPFGLSPWEAGQIVYLPEGWDVSRGRAPLGYGVGVPVEVVDGFAVPPDWIPDGEGGFMPPPDGTEGGAIGA